MMTLSKNTGIKKRKRKYELGGPRKNFNLLLNNDIYNFIYNDFSIALKKRRMKRFKPAIDKLIYKLLNKKTFLTSRNEKINLKYSQILKKYCKNNFSLYNKFLKFINNKFTENNINIGGYIKKQRIYGKIIKYRLYF